MTILKCSAVKCVYNKEELCSKGGIDVVGENEWKKYKKIKLKVD